MNANSLLIATLMVVGTLAGPAGAECDNFSKKYALFQVEAKDLASQLARRDAMKPKPSRDLGVCQAALRIIKDSPYFVVFPERSCFQTDEQVKDFVANVNGLATSSATLAGLLCSDEDRRRGVKSVLDGDTP